MVGVLIAMKTRVLGNSMRGTKAVQVAFGALFGLILGLVTLFSAFAELVRPTAAVDVLATLFGLWGLGWILGPLVTGGSDETLRAEQFSLLPIPPRKLAFGLLIAGFVGVPPVVTLIAFGGLVAYGAQLGFLPVLVGIVFTVLLTFTVVVLSRVVLAAVGAVLTTRKGRDVGVILVSLLAFSGVAFNYLLNAVGPAIVQGRASALTNVLRALPTGWGPLAVHAADGGNWGLVLSMGIGLLLLSVLLLMLYAVLLARRLTVATDSGGEGRARSRRGRAPGLLPTSPVGAVAAKELRLWWRDSRRRVALLTSVLVGGLLVVMPQFGNSGGEMGALPYLSIFVVGFACLQSGNLYGFDGSALWHTLSVPDAVRADVRGRQLAWLLMTAPVGVLLGIVLPVVAATPQAYPWIFGLLPVVLGSGSGLVLLLSVFVPIPLPRQRANASPLSSGGQPGCARGLSQLAVASLLMVAALPPAALLIAGEVTGQGPLTWLAAPVGLAIGVSTWWWWGRLAIRGLHKRGPELLAEISKGA